jgi:hypothetical protein
LLLEAQIQPSKGIRRAGGGRRLLLPLRLLGCETEVAEGRRLHSTLHALRAWLLHASWHSTLHSTHSTLHHSTLHSTL